MALDPGAMLQLQKINLQERFGTKDLESQNKFLKRGWRMDRNELGRQHRFKDASLTDELGGRGLGFSGIAQGAHARGLGDLVFNRGRAALDIRSQTDALKRAMQKLKEESALNRMGVMLSARGGGEED